MDRKEQGFTNVFSATASNPIQIAPDVKKSIEKTLDIQTGAKTSQRARELNAILQRSGLDSTGIVSLCAYEDDDANPLSLQMVAAMEPQSNLREVQSSLSSDRNLKELRSDCLNRMKSISRELTRGMKAWHIADLDFLGDLVIEFHSDPSQPEFVEETLKLITRFKRMGW